jgi:hypothetical protein
MKRLFCTVLLSAMIISVAGCGSADQSTPRQTIESARTALEQHHWNQLYDLIDARLRARRLPRWRDVLINLLEDNPESASVSADQVKELTLRQIFRTFMEVLSRTPKFDRVLSQYESAKYTVKRLETDRARVTFSSKLPLPHRTIILTRNSGQWVIAEFE